MGCVERDDPADGSQLPVCNKHDPVQLCGCCCHHQARVLRARRKGNVPAAPVHPGQRRRVQRLLAQRVLRMLRPLHRPHQPSPPASSPPPQVAPDPPPLQPPSSPPGSLLLSLSSALQQLSSASSSDAKREASAKR